MRIDSGSVQLTSDHRAVVRDVHTETLCAWVGERRPDFERQGAGPAALPPAVVLDLQEPPPAPIPVTSATDAATEPEPEVDPKLALLIDLVERLTGQKIELLDASDLRAEPTPEQAAALQRVAQATDGRTGPPPRAGWGIEYDRHTEHHEVERTTFAAEGVIHTRDGQTIAFRLDVVMAREFHQTTDVSLRAGDAVRKDPLVINFDGNAAQLTDTRFSFDIDADGQAERVAFVGAGSGFLALDHNTNGRIDDGSELFGARTGDGFTELAAHDADANGWIDAADPIYDRLQVWTRNAAGADTLTSLAASHVGAIYLGRVATPFELRTATNDSLGAVRSTGIYLTEAGRAGTVQQLDLSV